MNPFIKKIKTYYTMFLVLLMFTLSLRADTLTTSGQVFSIDKPVNLKTSFEPSGLCGVNQKLYTVNDENGDPSIYLLEARGNTYQAIKFLSLTGIKKEKQKLDLEGIYPVEMAAFGQAKGNGFLLVDERNRRLLLVDAKGKTAKLKTNLKKYMKKKELVYSKKKNAGWEAVAYSTVTKQVIIANEKKPAMLFFAQPNKKKLKIVGHLDLTKLYKIKDISDLYTEGDYLYILHRKGFEIVRMNLHTLKIDKRLSYRKIEEPLYQNPKRVAQAEGLWMEKDTIWLALDSNGVSYKERMGGAAGSLIRLIRPVGF